MLKSLKNEDWTSTLIGIILLIFVVLFPAMMKNNVILFFTIGLLSFLGYLFMGNKGKGFILSFVVIFALALAAKYLSMVAPIKKIGLEAVFFAVAIGLLIRNTVGLPKWLAPAVRSEYYIKAGLVILGTSILFKEIMKAGSLGMIQAVIVVFCVWYFTFTIAKLFKVDREMGGILSSAVSIC